MPFMTLRFVAALAGLGMSIGTALPPPDVPRVFDQRAGDIPEFHLQLAAGSTEVFETANLGPGTDPVLHLWDVAANREAAVDDNSGGGRAARLQVVVPHSGDYVLIVRPRAFAKGTLDLRWNGQAWHDDVAYGTGRYLPLLRVQAREQIASVAGPAGPGLHTVYHLAADGVHMQRRILGVPLATWTVPDGAPAELLLLFGVVPGRPGAPIRVYRNDAGLPADGGGTAGSDSDGDGLGFRLEGYLKTCSAATDAVDGVNCAAIADLRDTDGDGLGDGWEVLGRTANGRYLALPGWGADPRHKDMFVEVDFRRLTLQENADAERVTMSADAALAFAAAYADAAITDPARRAAHAALVGNPDGKPGIAVHLDTGRPPADPSHAAIYGDWGGYNTVDAVERDGVVDGVPPHELVRTGMHASRRGVFRYGPGHTGGSGQCLVNHIACGFGLNDVNPAHEMGHSLGLDHSGPAGILPLGANCKPNYPSLMNYGYYTMPDPHIGGTFAIFSDGRGRRTLNNAALLERYAFDVNTPEHAMRLSSSFNYLIDPVEGHVDWNRDGVFAPRGEHVRAYANSRAGGDCEFTRMNELTLAGTLANAEPASVAITRAGTHTLVVHLQGREVQYRRSTSTFACPAAVKDCPGSTFTAPVTLDFAGPVVGVDAEAVKIDGAYEISVVAVMANGMMNERRFALQPNGELVLSPDTRRVPSLEATGEPSLAETRDGTAIYLAYKDATGAVWLHYRTGAQWGEARRALVASPTGVAPVAHAEGSPGIAHAWLPRPEGRSAELYMALLTATDGFLHLYRLDVPTGRWADSSLLADRPRLVGRPAMAWVPDAADADQPGQFWLVGHLKEDDRTYVALRTYYDPVASRIRVGMAASFDNIWLGGGSIDVTASSSAGAPQLWAVLARPGNAEKRIAPSILFRPRADGIVDLVYRDHDDWATMGWSLCTVLTASADPPPFFTTPIRCRARPW
jgi:hypothetical protein